MTTNTTDGLTRTIVPRRELYLKRTLLPLGGRLDSSGWWRTMRTPEGPATLLVRRNSTSVEGQAWGGGARWCLDELPELIGEGDDGGLETDHPLVRRLARENPGVRFGRTRLVTDVLVTAILEQRVTSGEARRSLRYLEASHSEEAPGPGERRLPPDPIRLARTPYYDLHRAGVEKTRADTLRRVCRDARRLDSWADLAPEETRARLERYPGVGEWSSAKTVIASHGDADAVPVGDFHLKHQVVYHLTGRARGTDAEMMELLAPFRPHRGRVVRLLTTLPHYPAFGPRRPINDIRSR